MAPAAARCACRRVPSACSGIDKRFGAVHGQPTTSISTVRAGTVHGIVGENGAGKSTLMSILYGFYQADGGAISVDGPAGAASAARPGRHRAGHRHGAPALHAGRTP